MQAPFSNLYFLGIYGEFLSNTWDTLPIYEAHRNNIPIDLKYDEVTEMYTIMDDPSDDEKATYSFVINSRGVAIRVSCDSNPNNFDNSNENQRKVNLYDFEIFYTEDNESNFIYEDENFMNTLRLNDNEEIYFEISRFDPDCKEILDSYGISNQVINELTDFDTLVSKGTSTGVLLRADDGSELSEIDQKKLVDETRKKVFQKLIESNKVNNKLSGMGSLKEQLDEARTKLEATQRQIEQLLNNEDIAIKQGQTLQDKITELNTEKKRLTEVVIPNLNNQIKQKEEENEKLQGEVNTLSTNLTTLIRLLNL